MGVAVGRGVGLGGGVGVAVGRGVGLGVAVGRGMGGVVAVGKGVAVGRVHGGVNVGVGSAALAEGAGDVDVAGALQQPATTRTTASMSPVMRGCAGGRRSIMCSPME